MNNYQDSHVLNKHFDQIYIINLIKRNDKLNLIKFKLNRLNIKYKIFEAVYNPNGMIGLLMSYHKLLSDAVLNNYSNILILEDDCTFMKKFNTSINNVNFEQSDVIYLGCNQIIFDPEQIRNINSNLPYEISKNDWCKTFGTFSIGMNKNFYTKLLTELNIMTNPIDVQIQNLIIKYNFKSIVIYPYLTIPDVSTSDIIGPRSQTDYASSRKFNIDDFNYISVNSINNFNNWLCTNNISLRQMFWPNTLSITKKNIIDKFSTEIKTDLVKILNFLSDELNIKIIEFFELIEGYNNKFVFIIPSFNNIDNYNINLQSIISQTYPKYLYRIIYIDDCSTDETYNNVKFLMLDTNIKNQMQIYQQVSKGTQGLGRYLAWNMAYDDEIAIMLDGDDWLQNSNVLNKLNDIYINNDVLVTYGSYCIYDDPLQPKSTDIIYGQMQGTRKFPTDVIKNNTYKCYDWISSHLRTMYVKLLKNIKLNDLLDEDGFFFNICTDKAEMVPCLEMAGSKHINNNDLMCVYNKINSLCYSNSIYLNDENIKQKRLKNLSKIKQQKSYDKLIWDKKLNLEQNLTTINVLALDYASLSKLSCKFVSYRVDLIETEQISLLTSLAYQTNSLISTDLPLNLTTYNYIVTSEKHQYVMFQSIYNDLIKIIGLPGIYNRLKLCMILSDKTSIDTEICISCLI